MAAPKSAPARPLSPHLQIWRPTLTMTMSILHRITGGALYFGTLLLAAWLISAATSAQAFDTMQWLMGSWLGLIVLLGFTWALMHHMLGGLKHLVWDTGAGFGPAGREQMALWSLIGSIALTVLVWIVGYALR
jgi:succinate dehydrogenase / fumarate reductase cytochrome b subunit